MINFIEDIMEQHEKEMQEAHYRKADGCFNCSYSWINEAEVLECFYFGMAEQNNICDKWEKQ